MQCAPTAAAAAAELVAGVLDQSLHAWESGPFALELERQLIAEMASWVGYEQPGIRNPHPAAASPT